MSDKLVKAETTGLVTKKQAKAIGPALTGAIALWADATTDATSARRREYLVGKARFVADFFKYTGKAPWDISEIDVKTWQALLESDGQAPATVYAKLSRVSSFYEWAMQDDGLSGRIGRNPVKMARPKAPKPYQNSKSLSDESFNDLLAAIPTGTLTGKRDRVMILFYILTGHRRSEVCGLTWGNLERNGKLMVTFRVKGGEFLTEEVNLICWDALIEYLEAAGRLATMEKDTPLWVGHDRAGQASGALSSHSFAKNLKRYARLAGLDGIHVHRLRHTFARMVGDDTGDIGQVQTALNHKSRSATAVYLRSVARKKDTHSAGIAARLEL